MSECFLHELGLWRGCPSCKPASSARCLRGRPCAPAAVQVVGWTEKQRMTKHDTSDSWNMRNICEDLNTEKGAIAYMHRFRQITRASQVCLSYCGGIKQKRETLKTTFVIIEHAKINTTYKYIHESTNPQFKEVIWFHELTMLPYVLPFCR